jgi:peptide/nickel transport system ATP-binding protein
MTPAPPPLLAIEGLRLGLANRDGPGPDIVRGLALTLEPGTTHCLVGESGSGKSISALAIMGLLPPAIRVTGGSVRFEGKALLDMTAARRRALLGRRMAMIFQEPMTALNPVQRIGDQIGEMFAIHHPLSRAERRDAVLALLKEVRLPDPLRAASSFPHELSGGQRQRAMIAMAIALRPALLIADEPTTALDVTTQRRILTLLKDLQASHGMAMLFITHDFGVVADIADTVTILHRGDQVEQGPTTEVLGNPSSAPGRALLAAVPRLVPPPPKPASGPAPTPLLQARGLNKAYPVRSGLFRTRPRAAVTDVSLSVSRGEMLGIVGESGSGKSTVARMLLGLIRPDSGTIQFDGQPIDTDDRKALHRIRSRLQPVFQDPTSALNRHRRVADTIAQGPINYGTSKADALAAVPALLDLVGLDPTCGSRYPHQFSGGQRQRICIARALALRPDLLIADEAVSALDVSVQAQILDLLRQLRGRLGLAVILITHDLRVAAQQCDRLMVMQLGRCVEEGPTADVFRAPSSPYTAELLSAVPGQRHFGGRAA